MDNQIAYSFNSSQNADRFLNILKRGAISEATARRYKGGTSIIVSYPEPNTATFHSTCQQLDDLAANFGGTETPL